MPDNTSSPTYDGLMSEKVRLSEQAVRLISQLDRTEEQLADARDVIRRIEALTQEAERHLGKVRATRLRAALEGTADA